MLTCKVTLPDSTHPVIISKNPGFQALHLAGRNEFRFFSFNKYNNCFSLWLLTFDQKIRRFPKKITDLLDSWAAVPPAR